MQPTREPEFCRSCIEGIRIPVLLLVTACGIIVALLLPPIAQPPGSDTSASPQRASNGPSTRIDARIVLTSSYGALLCVGSVTSVTIAPSSRRSFSGSQGSALVECGRLPTKITS